MHQENTNFTNIETLHQENTNFTNNMRHCIYSKPLSCQYTGFSSKYLLRVSRQNMCRVILFKIPSSDSLWNTYHTILFSMPVPDFIYNTCPVILFTILVTWFYTGSVVDFKRIQKFFRSTLKFECHIEEDLSKEALQEFLEETANMFNTKRTAAKYYCVLVFIMSHGNEVCTINTVNFI